MLVVGAIYILGSVVPIGRAWARVSIFAAVWLVIIWYLQWRITVTVLPGKGKY